MGLLDTLMKGLMQEATIVHKSELSEAAYHIRIQSEGIKKASFVPGYFLRLAVGIDNDEVSIKDKRRSYTVWDIDQFKGTVDLAVATHSGGIGTQWVNQCQLGDTLFFGWHKGKFLADDTADSYLMIGDLSALAHLYKINRSLSPHKTIQGIFYSQDKKDLFPDLDGSKPFSFYEMPQDPLELIIRKIEEKVLQMTGKKMVYIAGDSRVCVALSRYFRKDLQWPSKQVKVKPFWNPEKKGLE